MKRAIYLGVALAVGLLAGLTLGTVSLKRGADGFCLHSRFVMVCSESVITGFMEDR